MFVALMKICDNIQRLDENKPIMAAIRQPETKRHIVYLNAFDQLFVGGLNSYGEIVGKYSSYTENINSSESFQFMGLTKRKIAGDAYFFYDSGGFLKSFRVSVKKEGFTIVADDEIDDEFFGSLTEKFGKKLLGLTDESKMELGQKIAPLVARLVKEEMFK